jgi:hypothetical protein
VVDEEILNMPGRKLFQRHILEEQGAQKHLDHRLVAD